MEKELEALKAGHDDIEYLSFFGTSTVWQRYPGFLTDVLDEIQYFDKLVTLDLSRCQLKQEYCLQIRDIVKHVKPLSALIIADNEFRDEGICELVVELKLSNLFLVDLRRNPIKSKGLEALAEYVAVNNNLISLELAGVGLSLEDEKKFAKALETNYSLRKFSYDTSTQENGDQARDKYDKVQNKVQKNILQYKENMLKKMKGDATGKWNKSKLMFVGQGRAGKTSTVRRVLGQPFDAEEKSTIGASYTQIQTTTTAESKWLTLSPADAEYLGQGMAQESAATSFLQNKMYEKRAEALKNFNQKERRANRSDSKRTNDEDLRRSLRIAAAREKKKEIEQKVRDMERRRQQTREERDEIRRQKRISENQLRRVVEDRLVNQNRAPGLITIRELRMQNVNVDLLGSRRVETLLREIYRDNGLRYDPLLNETIRRQEEVARMRVEMHQNFYGKTGHNAISNVDDMFDTRKRNLDWDVSGNVQDALALSTETNKDSLTFSLCDFGGQEVFYTLHHLFLTKFGIYVLCVDLREVLEKPKVCEAYMKFWFSSISMHASSAPIVLVGTHFDCFNHDRKILKVLNEYFTEAKYFDFEGKYPTVLSYSDLFFYPIDNMKDIGIDELRNDIERVTRNQEFVTQEISLKWIFCLETMMSLRTKKPPKAVEEAENHPQRRSHHNSNGHVNNTSDSEQGSEEEEDNPSLMPDWLTLDTVTQVAGKVNLFETEEIDDMLTLFHELGVLVHLTGTHELSQLVVLNPQWLIDGLCCVIRDKDLHFTEEFLAEVEKAGLTKEWTAMYNTGIASEDLLFFLWREETFKQHTAFFLDMMKRMILLSDYNFEAEDERKYLVPSLLVSKYEDDKKEVCLEDYIRKRKPHKNRTKRKAPEELPGKNVIKSIIVKDKRIREGKEIHYCVLTFSNATQAKTPFLPTGLFQRLVCFCVSYSSSVNSTASIKSLAQPELYSSQAKISMAEGMIIHLEQRDEEIWFFVEDLTQAPLCLRAITSILGKLNADLLGSGLTWDMSFNTVIQGEGSATEEITYSRIYEVVGVPKQDDAQTISLNVKSAQLEQLQRSFTKAEAEANKLHPWFEPEDKMELEDKVEETLELESFLDNFMEF
eukprot:snap_masked-scaffold_47-processed-gene-0.10-mRNA-1 protein AED:0.40 eAED:0.42 QI:0/-1/0/1/-1/1/1/0/1107